MARTASSGSPVLSLTAASPFTTMRASSGVATVEWRIWSAVLLASSLMVKNIASNRSNVPHLRDTSPTNRIPANITTAVTAYQNYTPVQRATNLMLRSGVLRPLSVHRPPVGSATSAKKNSTTNALMRWHT